LSITNNGESSLNVQIEEAHVLVPPCKGFLYPPMFRFSFKKFYYIFEKCILIKIAIVALPLLDWAEKEACLVMIFLVINNA
jgi:hypothetical protein